MGCIKHFEKNESCRVSVVSMARGQEHGYSSAARQGEEDSVSVFSSGMVEKHGGA